MDSFLLPHRFNLSLAPDLWIHSYKHPELSDTPPLLCFHGWLDNASSFFPLAEHFPSLPWCAIDIMGHGHSSWRPVSSFYYFVDYLCDTCDLINTHFPNGAHVLGHSLGTGVALLLAGLLPEKIHSVALIDGFGPLVSPQGMISEQLRFSLSQHAQSRPMRRYGSVEAMALARKKRHDIDTHSCRLLAQYGHLLEGEHYRWSFDPKLFQIPPFQMVESQVLEILENACAPTLLIQAASGYKIGQNLFENRRAILSKQLTHTIVPGHHHVHMDNPQAIIEPLTAFWQSAGLL